MDNRKLKKDYEEIYIRDETMYFSKFIDGVDISDTNKVVLENLEDLVGKVVIDLGCGEGILLNQIVGMGCARAIGVDYSIAAIENARKRFVVHNLEFFCDDILNLDFRADIIISNGTLEHMDDPLGTLEKCASLLNDGGLIYLTCPHFYNLRGIIWITLQKLFDVPMSLTDIHSITPLDIERWSRFLGLEIVKTQSYDFHRATGTILLNDLRKRLNNALADAKMDNSKVDKLLEFCADFILYQESFENQIQLEGQNMLYVLRKA